jgi:pyridoxal phosphate enzyme (YggS family)
MIAENLKFVRQQIAEVCRRCGRNPDEVLLVAVSKTFPKVAIDEALAAGQRDFGENYVQEWQDKRVAVVEGAVRWHLIGHLQTNKAKFILQGPHLIHSIDDLRLVAELQRRLEIVDQTLDVLIEVHSTEEATKFGVRPDDVIPFIRQAAHFHRVRIRGLMTMGPFADDPERSRPSFRLVRELRDRVNDAAITGVEMRHLSMGMTHDMDIGIEEGATIVRIGTAIFGNRQKRVSD